MESVFFEVQIGHRCEQQVAPTKPQRYLHMLYHQLLMERISTTMKEQMNYKKCAPDKEKHKNHFHLTYPWLHGKFLLP